MKINSNTIKLEKNEYVALEDVIKKIASMNNIDNVDRVNIQLSQEEGTIKFSMKDFMKDSEEEDTDNSSKKECDN